MNTLLASVCYVVLATGATHCDEPVKFDDARRKVEAVTPFFDPTLDKTYTYLKPIEPVDEARAKELMRPVKPTQTPTPTQTQTPTPAPTQTQTQTTTRQVEPEPFVSKYNTRKYPPRYARGEYRATMKPVP
jgi:carbohydrate-binding DOMON domain-containing protein